MALMTVVSLTVATLVVLLVRHLQNASKSKLSKHVKQLPGPKGLPVIGSVHELPDKNSWMKFHEWGEKYGPIYLVNLAGTNHVVISRDKIAHDLLSKRSAIYSDRPLIPALEQDNRTSGQYLPLMSSNEIWTRQRKFAKQIMDTSQQASFHGYPELESIRLLFELMTSSSKYNVAMESFIARVTSRLAWGTSTPSDELKQRARELLIGVSPTGALGNKLPFIMGLPERLMAAKAWESRRSRTERKFFETMQQEVQNEMDRKTKPTSGAFLLPRSIQPKQSWMRTFLEKKATWGFASDLEGAFAVGMHGIAGALTIAAPMQSFCLALCHYPQYQHILHEEVDRVLGDRMPTFDDMSAMPVLRAFVRETLRWRPPVPTGIPHELTQDDVYEGYHIPAGSVVHPLEWSISRDPEVFPEPDAWNPLRWLESSFPTYQEPLTKYPTITQYTQFGYGRRTCQGMGVTEADLFVGLGSVAWLFSMSKPGSGTAVTVSDATKAMDDGDAAVDDGSALEPDYFERNAERVKRESRNHATVDEGLQTPSASDDGTMSTHGLGKPKNTALQLTMHANDSAISIPGTFPMQQPLVFDLLTPPATPAEEKTALSSQTPTSRSKPAPKEILTQTDDPTMDFSTLLIAKPMPFKFDLRIRNKQRAGLVARKWLDLKMEGEFEDARVFWGGGKSTCGDAEYGWGEVFA